MSDKKSGAKKSKPKAKPSLPKSSLKEQNRSLEASSKQFKAVALASIAINLILAAAVAIVAIENDGGGMADVNGLPETRDPALYSGQTREAYQAAKDIPAVIDGIYCYCYCKENFDHRSLLGCYIDDHAASCDVCQSQALRAQVLWDEGYSIYDISEKMDEEYGG